MTRRSPFWSNGLPTQLAIDVFTKGDCWTLAIEISKMSPLRPYLIDGGSHWVAGDGKLFLDIEGVHTRPKLLHRWGADSLRLADQQLLDYAHSDVMDPSLYNYQHELDRPRLLDAARRVLDAHGARMGLVKQ